MEALLLLLSLIIAALNSVSLSFLCDALFERRLSNLLHRVCLLATIPLLCFCLIQIPGGASLIRAASFLFSNFLILCLFRGKLLVHVCIALLHYFIATALETVLLPIVLMGYKLSIRQFWQEPGLVAMVYLIPMAIMVVGCLIFARILRGWKNQIELPASQWVAIFLFLVFTLFELYFAGILISSDSALIPLLPILGVVLLLMNVGLLLLLNKLTLNHQMAQERLALQEQMRYIRLSMQATTENYDAQRSLTHDFEHHLLTISQLLQSGQSEQALRYAQSVLSGVTKAEVAVSTNNPIADAVLNQKYRKAQELGVQMHFLVSDLASFPLSTDEMATTLANLLDNALEACVRDCSGQKKSIRVKLLMEPALATLSVQNTSLPVMISHEGELPSTKEQASAHGYGLKTCKKILQRSGFDFALQYKDGWFQFTAIKAL